MILARIAAAGVLAAKLCTLDASAIAENANRMPGGSALLRLSTPPLGLPPLSSSQPASEHEVALGKRLFFDPKLSRDGKLSCATCHIPANAFADSRTPTALGRDGLPLRRNAPTLLNVGYVGALFRDGRAVSLEAQVAGPLFDQMEMANSDAGDLVARLERSPEYAALFERAYGGGPTMPRIASALAGYERTLLSGNSAFDRWFFGGEMAALTPSAIEGYFLFVGRADCVACHKIGSTHALFTDDDFHFIGTGYRAPAQNTNPVTVGPDSRAVTLFGRAGAGLPALDLGRHEVTGDPADQWRFRTPSLRNVALTAPYMHDGSLATLRDVVLYYNYTGVWHDRLDPRIRPLGLTGAEVAALVAFLESLTGDNLAEIAADAPEPSVAP